jgi:hypothetical protein
MRSAFEKAGETFLMCSIALVPAAQHTIASSSFDGFGMAVLCMMFVGVDDHIDPPIFTPFSDCW